MVTSMLEKAIEIEGLLRIIRDGKPLPETYKLLNAKTASLAMEATSLAVEAESKKKKEEDTPKPASPTVDFVMASPAPADATPEVDFTAVEPAPAEEQLVVAVESGATQTVIVADLPDADLDLTEEDDIILSFDDFTEPAPAEETPEETPQPTDIEPETETKPEDVTNTETVPEDSIDMYAGQETDREDSTTESPAESAEPEAIEKDEKTDETPRRTTRLKAAFSLNDRFLYARELFNGNMKIFDSTLEFIEGIDDYSLVEDYFYSELEWDPENANVASFMEILRPQFKE